MTEYEMIEWWKGVFAICKAITFFLTVACMIKYLIT